MIGEYNDETQSVFHFYTQVS